MNTKTDSATWRGVCAGCGHPFTEWAWWHRHDINETDAHLHSLDVGDYHDQCCPLATCTTADSGEVTVA